MGQDWIQYDKNFPQKPATLRLMQLTGADVDQVTGRMTRCWSWVDDHVKADGVINLGFETMAHQFGGPAMFWEALLDPDVGWLARTADGKLRVTGFKKRFGKSSKIREQNRQRQERKRIRDAELAAIEFEKMSRGVTNVTSNGLDETRRDERTGEENFRSSSTAAPHLMAVGVDVVDQKNQVTNLREEPGERPNSVPTASKQHPISKTPPKLLAASEIDWMRADADATRWSQRLGLGPVSRIGAPDRNLLLKLGALAQTAALEGVIAGAVGVAAEKGRRPMAYLHGTLTEQFAVRGLDFNQTLRRMAVPQDIQNFEPRSLASVLGMMAS